MATDTKVVQGRFSVCGLPVDQMTMSGALSFVRERVRDAAHPAYIVCANPEKVYSLRRAGALKRFFDSADLIIPDGVGVVLAARILYGYRLRRVAGADLMQAICAAGAQRGFRIFLYGGSPDVNREASRILEARYPGIRIVGSEHGYIRGDEKDGLVNRINAARPDILFVALGSPRQELWIQENLSRLEVKVIEGIGGTLDTIAGTIRRAPVWMQTVGLEWFYRLLRQPSRVGRHVNLVRFVVEVLAEKANGLARRTSGVPCGDSVSAE